MKASRMIPTVLTLTVASMAAGAAFGAGWKKTVTTTATAPWVEAAATEEPRAEATRAVVDVADGGRKVIGFGTALSELGWRAISALPEAKRATVLDGLFGSDGAALNVIRLPLGASDFSFDFFSYDETPGDFELKDFSLARDEKNLLPLIREAQRRVGKDLLVWASPWSPPQWMKKSGHYADCPGGGNDLKPEQRAYVGEDAFKADARHLEAYARYFRKYVDGYRALGVPIWMVMPQNEYMTAQYWPSCVWRNSTLAKFVGRYLGPALEGSGTEIYLGTLDRNYSFGLVDIAMQDKLISRYVTGVGCQWAGLICMEATLRLMVYEAPSAPPEYGKGIVTRLKALTRKRVVLS